MHVARHNPNKGSDALASIVELPRDRIRTWVDDGGAPDVVRGLNTATEYGWFEDDTATTTAWATLLTGIFGGGSIAIETYQPQWTTVPELATERVSTAMERLGVGATTVDRDGRPTQLQPEQNPSLLGRALQAIGAPAGRKNDETLEALPDWVFQVDSDARRAAVELLVMYRGHANPDKDTVQLFETRSRSFRESAAELIESVIDSSVNPGSRYVIIPATAARELGVGHGGPLREALEQS
jgi:hypothetical protein